MVKLEKNFHMAAWTGRIFPSLNKILETGYGPDLHSMDRYAVDKKVAADTTMPYERDPSNTEASAVKANLYQDEKKALHL